MNGKWHLKSSIVSLKSLKNVISQPKLILNSIQTGSQNNQIIPIANAMLHQNLMVSNNESYVEELPTIDAGTGPQ